MLDFRDTQCLLKRIPFDGQNADSNPVVACIADKCFCITQMPRSFSSGYLLCPGSCIVIYEQAALKYLQD